MVKGQSGTWKITLNSHNEAIVTGLSSYHKLLKLETHEIIQTLSNSQCRDTPLGRREEHMRNDLLGFLPGGSFWPALQADDVQAEHGLTELRGQRWN